MIGSILFWGWVGVVGLVVTVLNVLAWPFFNPWVDRKRVVATHIGKLWGKGIMLGLPFVRMRIEGREHLRTGGPFLIVANHQSVADIIVTQAYLPHVKMVAKDYAFKVFPLNLNMIFSGHIPARVFQDGALEQVGRDMTRWLGEGISVLVFAEGTRSPDGRVQRFRQGPFHIAKQAGVKVLPVSINGTGKILPKGTWRYTLHGEVHLKFHEPFEIGNDPKAAASKARQMIRDVVEGPPPPAPATAA